MTRPGGRPRTFPRAVVPVALELREREGRTWPEIARELKVPPGTLRSRVSDYRRAMHKTPAPGSFDPRADGGPGRRRSVSGEVPHLPPAAAYARVSRPDELPILENQKEAIRSYCEGRFDLGARLFVEVASGGRDDRSQLSQLIALVSGRGGPKVVVFTSLSRMTRGGIESALYILHQLERSGVGWHFVEQPVLNYDANTPPLAKDIILAVLAAVDKDYRRRISAATKAAYARRKALAEAQGAPLKWGRRGPGKKRVPPGTTSEREPGKEGTISEASVGQSPPPGSRRSSLKGRVHWERVTEASEMNEEQKRRKQGHAWRGPALVGAVLAALALYAWRSVAPLASLDGLGTLLAWVLVLLAALALFEAWVRTWPDAGTTTPSPSAQGRSGALQVGTPFLQLDWRGGGGVAMAISPFRALPGSGRPPVPPSENAPAPPPVERPSIPTRETAIPPSENAPAPPQVGREGETAPKGGAPLGAGRSAPVGARPASTVLDPPSPGGAPLPPKPRATDTDIAALLAQGRSYRAIARETGAGMGRIAKVKRAAAASRG